MPELPKDEADKDRISIRILDFQNAYDYSQSSFTQLFTYYALLERILNLEYFFGKLQSPVLDSLKLEDCVM